MFLRNTFSFKPTVLTAAPKRAEVGIPLCGVFSKTVRWIRIALYTFKNSIANTMLSFNKNFSKTEVEKA
jgi:hypothetical protein